MCYYIVHRQCSTLIHSDFYNSKVDSPRIKKGSISFLHMIVVSVSFVGRGLVGGFLMVLETVNEYTTAREFIYRVAWSISLTAI